MAENSFSCSHVLNPSAAVKTCLRHVRSNTLTLECRCERQGLPEPGYFPDLSGPEPQILKTLDRDVGEDEEVQALMAHGVLPRELGFSADCTVVNAERTTGAHSTSPLTYAQPTMQRSAHYAKSHHALPSSDVRCCPVAVCHSHRGCVPPSVRSIQTCDPLWNVGVPAGTLRQTQRQQTRNPAMCPPFMKPLTVPLAPKMQRRAMARPKPISQACFCSTRVLLLEGSHGSIRETRVRTPAVSIHLQNGWVLAGKARARSRNCAKGRRKRLLPSLRRPACVLPCCVSSVLPIPAPMHCSLMLTVSSSKPLCPQVPLLSSRRADGTLAADETERARTSFHRFSSRCAATAAAQARPHNRGGPPSFAAADMQRFCGRAARAEEQLRAEAAALQEAGPGGASATARSQRAAATRGSGQDTAKLQHTAPGAVPHRAQPDSAAVLQPAGGSDVQRTDKMDGANTSPLQHAEETWGVGNSGATETGVWREYQAQERNRAERLQAEATAAHERHVAAAECAREARVARMPPAVAIFAGTYEENITCAPALCQLAYLKSRPSQKLAQPCHPQPAKHMSEWHLSCRSSRGAGSGSASLGYGGSSGCGPTYSHCRAPPAVPHPHPVGRGQAVPQVAHTITSGSRPPVARSDRVPAPENCKETQPRWCRVAAAACTKAPGLCA